MSRASVLLFVWASLWLVGAATGAQSRTVDVAISIEDQFGQPIVDVPVSVLTCTWNELDDGSWTRRTDASGVAQFSITVEAGESHLQIEVASGTGIPDPRDTIDENTAYEDAVYNTWAVPWGFPISISDGAAAYSKTIVLRPKLTVVATINDAAGQPVTGISIGATNVIAGLFGADETSPFEFDGLRQGVGDVLIGYGDIPGNPLPFIIEVDAAQAVPPQVNVAAAMQTYTETTAKVNLSLGVWRPMIYSRLGGVHEVTLIAADGSNVYCFPRSTLTDGISFVLREEIGEEVYQESVPSVDPGRYFVAPGSLGYAPTWKLYNHILDGNDPTGSITEITAVADQVVTQSLNFVQLEQDIISLLGL